jgi:hypothetical protein
MHLPTFFPQPIVATIISEMGHLELVAQQHQVDPWLYRLVTDNIETTYEIVGGYGMVLYRAKQPNLVKEYQVHGQRYIVDFSHL